MMGIMSPICTIQIVGDTMVIKDANDLIWYTFEKWTISEDINLFKEYRVIQALNVCLDKCIESGDDYPAYYEDAQTESDINSQLRYISDRWKSSGRIRFILRVIDND